MKLIFKEIAQIFAPIQFLAEWDNLDFKAELDRGFFLSRTEHMTWGTTRGALWAQYPNLQPNSCPSFLGIPTIRSDISIGQLTRDFPITGLSYDLQSKPGLTIYPILRALTRKFGSPSEKDLSVPAKGKPVDHIRDTVVWSLENTYIRLSFYGAPRQLGSIFSPGVISHFFRQDKMDLLAEPIWGQRGGYDLAWKTEESRCEFYAFEIKQLYQYERKDKERASVLSHLVGWIADNPKWISLKFQGSKCKAVVWFHPDAKHWGIAGPEYTYVFPWDFIPQFSLSNLLPAKGGGGSSLSFSDGFFDSHIFLSDLSGMDQFVEFLGRRFDQKIPVTEGYDC